MIESVAFLFRTLQLVSGCGLLGLLSFTLIRRAVGPQATPLYRPLLVLSAGFLLAGVGTLAGQAALATGNGAAFVDFSVWQEVLSSTRFGRIWRWREGFMLLVLGSLTLRAAFPNLPQERNQLLLAWIGAMAGVALASASGHAAAFDPAWPLIMSHALHLVAVAVWIGALLPVFLELRRSAHDYARAPAAAQLFQRFARVAAISMALIVFSGSILAVANVGGFAALLGTSYGLWLSAKLVFVGLALAIAARLRWSFLPSFSSMPPGLAAGRAWGLVALEFAVACLALLCACVLGSQAPARHEDIDWWLPFRFAPEATWNLPGVALRVGFGAALMMAGGWVFLLRRDRRNMLLIGSLVIVAAGLAVSLPPLAVPAFPDTYRKSTVSYHAISIDNGAQLFQRHCSACHGAGGAGDGPLAPTSPKPPADLTAPHAADHTAGDIFWWITHGIVAGNMPGFALTLTEEERWDVVNFLRTLSNGYQSRVIRPAAVSGKPWLAAPDFNYVTQFGVGGSLKQFRGKKPLMLVLFSWPQSRARLEWLDDNRGAIQDSGAEFVAVPLSRIPDTDLRAIRVPVAVQGAEETARTYLLLRRTLANPDPGDKGVPPSHVEFLIDRFGYVRARWLTAEGDEWNDAGAIANQIQRLNGEEEILPPPDEHIH